MCHGCGPVIPILTFMLTSDIHQSGMHLVIMATRLGMVTIYYFTWGGHALTSPKGGRPCSLGTLNHVVAGHLAYR